MAGTPRVVTRISVVLFGCPHAQQPERDCTKTDSSRSEAATSYNAREMDQLCDWTYNFSIHISDVVFLHHPMVRIRDVLQ